MAGMLDGIRVIEYAAFVAAPLAGMHLAQLGADVIRVDPIGGSSDIARWPLTEDGHSLYWASLNKGKRSIEIDMRSAGGRELLRDLIVAPGAGRGIFLTNMPVKGPLAYEALRERRPDIIMAVLEGNQDGSSALDYTVNSASGIPFITGEASATAPVNHALPAWDVAAGLTLAAGLLAAERRRLLSGSGELIRLALSDVAFTTVANLGYLAEVEVNGVLRRSLGNYLYGAFGRDFATRDGRLVMVVALTSRQWRALAETTGIEEAIASIAAGTGLDPESEGDRFLMREEIAAALEPWFLARTLGEVRNAFDGTGVCWGPYQDFGQLLQEDPRCSPDNPVFGRISHPTFGETLTPASPLRFANSANVAPARAPVLGEHTDDVLRGVLGFDAARIAAARRDGLIDGSSRRF